MRNFIVVVTLLLAKQAAAFPELTRHGYNSCLACHVSPAGGGLLTSYGRSLSAEVLSTWGSEKDAGLFWRAADREKLEKYVLVGGDLRGVQVHHENRRLREGEFIKMQADIELGVVRDGWGADLSVGELEDEEWRPISRSYYAFWRPRDEITLRAGHFLPTYGLRLPDHIAFTRSYLGFGLDSARDSGEAQWTGADWIFNLTYSDHDGEKAFSGQAQYYFGERFKLAANVWRGKSEERTRNIYGLWGVLGLTKKLYWLTEADVQNSWRTGYSQAAVSFNRLGYSLLKGFDVFVQTEHLHKNLKDHGTITNRNGLGLQFYPLPHLELSGIWNRQKSQAPGALEEDYAWILFHYFL